MIDLVKEIAGKIARSLNFSEEEIKLAKVIGVLHGIARFEQYKRFQTFSDLKSIDHGDYGVEMFSIWFKKQRNTRKNENN